MLYSRSLLVIYFKYSSMYMYIAYMRNLKKYVANELIYNKEIDSQT